MAKPDETQTVEFHYLKDAGTIDHPVNGVFGGLNPSTGHLVLSFFSERPTLPKKITYELSATGVLGGEISRDTKQGIVRSIHAIHHMDIVTAKAVHSWIGEKIAEHDSVKLAASKKNNDGSENA